MKLHSDVLTKTDIHQACTVANQHGQDIFCDEIVEQGSQKRKRGITFYCEALSGPRSRNGRDGYAASWDAYGWVIAELFNRDPNAIIGWYESPSHFLLECRTQAERRKERDKKTTGDFLNHLKHEVTTS